jgi:uncharacterized protein YycO
MKIAFYKGHTIIDKIILFFSRGGYNHVSIVLDDGRIIEAYPFKGVRVRNDIFESMHPKTAIDIFEVYTTPEQDEIIKDFLMNQIGKKYDYHSVFGFVFYTTEEGRRQSGRWMCSELVFAAFKQVGINLLERVDAWKVSPTILSFNPNMKFISSATS